ncbi:MAG: type I pullulanase [Spirochaetaceae bacterium]|nr:type I pullulanase [Spirochaetaceae bacterium]
MHYYRYNGDFEGWNVWAWPAEPPGNGQGYDFDSGNIDVDGFVSARIFFPGKTTNSIGKIGMIIRRSGASNDWAEKDVNSDRFTGEKEVWLVQNDPVIYTEKPPIAKPPIFFAAAESSGTVSITLSANTDDYGSFAVYEGERKLSGVSAKAAGGALEGKEQSGAGPFMALITLDEKITDASKLYTVQDESGKFTGCKVTMRGILDSYYYDGNDLGLTYRSAESGFKVWAPSALAVSVALYDNPGEYNASGKVTDQQTANLYPMEKDPKTGVWSALVRGDLKGNFYLYRVEFADGTVNWAADPYAKAVSANGQRMAVVNLAAANPPGWRPKQKPPFKPGAWQDAVIYELHVRDFSVDENSGMKHKGKYLAFTERGTANPDGVSTGVDHLVRLGISHVHLLPAFDFATINELAVDDPASAEPKFNWGYDPMHYNVPEGSYSSDPENPAARITEFKAMVQSLHDAGIRVIMDLVLNHTSQTGSWPFDSLVPGYYYRTTGTGTYANGSGCGNEIASERPMVRKFILDSCRYWLNEYNVDGFRFDLMGLMDTPTMKQLTEELRRIDPSFIIYGEPWTAGNSVLPQNLQTLIGAQKGLGFAVFNDRLRGAIKGGSDDASRGFAAGARSMEAGIVRGITGSVNDFTAQANESVNYVTAHDNLNLWDKIALSLGAKDLANDPYSLLKGKRDIFECDAVKSVLLANGIILTSQGIVFFQAGDEMLRSKFGDHNSYASPDSINKIRWENAGLYREAVDYHAGLIRLRKEHPAFRQTLKADIERTVEIITAEDRGVSFTIKHPDDSWPTIFVAYNGSPSPKTFSLPGTVPLWRQVVDSRRAGTESLAEFSGSIALPPLSMAVLHE